MLERDVERYFVERVRKAGGLAMKFTSPSMVGVPDRLVLLPGGTVFFAEVKAPGKKPTPKQLRVMERFRALGFDTLVIDSPERVDYYFALEDTA